MILHNSGNVPAFFIVSCQDPFSIDPKRGCLESKECVEFEIISKPMNTTTPLVGEIVFGYDDIKTTSVVECEVSEIDIGLDTTDVVFDEIYISLKDHRSLLVHNR